MENCKKVMASSTSKASNETINVSVDTGEECIEIKLTKIGTVFYCECDWGEDEYALYHEETTGDYFISSGSGLCITHCPSDPDDIDLDRVMEAAECFYNLYSMYGCMGFSYDNLEEDIQYAYDSIY